ncbi:hypothetical protein GLOTRDRAFT_129732 [Gloeophyllum trabeum ATCC 11539]|uniref:Uncharacterized protein n=1 Tax=Gloeophyllum trabeum (strain ATCC 11539 / FP-39264 / Madison 617) TaxID=670483 RepID=S7RRA2_GLOTA|nr:uncharacterized protein GLOTRDRAFT_129732 [Gloeophyllum trabeum ATCC 11539]EPQ55459.1 hypothetical protein GLOTRDRAFT_129732 [Gloeophyllum trabeum ATCC 11539]
MEMRSKQEDMIAKLLDQLALLLATGRRGEVVATIFTDMTLSEVQISFNEPPSAGQKKQAKELFDLLRGTTQANTIESLGKLRGFAHSHCAETIKARMERIRRSLHGSPVTTRELRRVIEELKAGGDKPISQWSDPPIRDWKNLRLVYENVDNLHASDLLSRMLDDTLRWSQNWGTGNETNLPDDEEVQRRCLIAHVLGGATILKDDLPPIIKLSSRLRKLGRFWHGLEMVIVWASNQFDQGNSIRYRWIPDDPRLDTPIPSFKLGTQASAIIQYLMKVRQSSLTYEELDHARLNAILAKLNPNEMICPTCHCEVRQILAERRHDNKPGSIGCNKRSCLTCKLWIECYNRVERTAWATNGSHYKPYRNWRLPGVYTHIEDEVIDIMEAMLFSYLVQRVITQELPPMRSDDEASFPKGSPTGS